LSVVCSLWFHHACFAWVIIVTGFLEYVRKRLTSWMCYIKTDREQQRNWECVCSNCLVFHSMSIIYTKWNAMVICLILKFIFLPYVLLLLCRMMTATVASLPESRSRKEVRSPFLWDVVLHHRVTGAQCLKTEYWSHFQGLKCS
jgi:hypothetical protein